MSQKKIEKRDDRRTFLKVAGASVVGAAAIPAVVAARSKAEEKPSGKQWAMAIDVSRCLRDEGCDKCSKACHTTHNIRDLSGLFKGVELKKREIKWIWKEHYEGAFPEQQNEFTKKRFHDKHVPVLCNHCKEPPCVRVCPTQATWKRESDGIVMMDMHRCIGCRYCVVGCPYGSRSFNFVTPWPRPFAKYGTPPNPDFPTRTKGVVEKCNFCAERLVKAQQNGTPFVPACVEACSNQALIFGDINDPNSAVRRVLEARHSIRRKPGLGTGPSVYYIV